MMAKTKPKSTQLSVWIDKKTRCNINKLMERDDVHTQADAISLATSIAVGFLQKYPWPCKVDGNLTDAN